MSDLLTSDDLKTERATEPSRAWKNVVWHPEATPYRQGIFGPGDVCSPAEWPTREVAEAKWRDWANQNDLFVERWSLQYLGAFPADEAP